MEFFLQLSDKEDFFLTANYADLREGILLSGMTLLINR